MGRRPSSTHPPPPTPEPGPTAKGGNPDHIAPLLISHSPMPLCPLYPMALWDSHTSMAQAGSPGMWLRNREAASHWAVALTEGRGNGMYDKSLPRIPEPGWKCFLSDWVMVWSRGGSSGEGIKWLWAGVGAQKAPFGPHRQQRHQVCRGACLSRH